MRYQRFEDIPLWQEARKCVVYIYRLVHLYFKDDYALINQTKRAAISIPLNIAEGFERKSNKEFANFINIAKGSAGEIRAILYIAKDLNYLPEQEFVKAKEQIELISKQLSRFGSYLITTHKKH